MKYYFLNNDLFDDEMYAFGEFGKIFNIGEAVLCEHCASALTLLEWIEPFTIKVSKKQIGDIICGTIYPFAVSERFKNLFLENDLKGIEEFIKAELYFRNKLLDVNYYIPIIKHKIVKIDLKKSNIKCNENELCSKCQNGTKDLSEMKGLYFLNEEDILEDILLFVPIGGTFFSNKLAELIKEYKLTNIDLVENKDFISMFNMVY